MPNITWKPIKPNPKLVWGPTLYAKDWSGHDLSNIMHDALTWATEHHVRISETQVIPIGGWYHLKVWYKPDQRVEDANGEPCWLSEL
jgi:hypothetical protein